MRILQAIAVVVAIDTPVIIFIAILIFRLIWTGILTVGDTVEITVQG